MHEHDREVLQAILNGVVACLEKLDCLGDLMSDLSAQEDAELSALASDLDQLGAKLDTAQADALTQEEVDKLHAVRAKADGLLAGTPTLPAPVPQPTVSGGETSVASSDQTGATSSDQTGATPSA